MAPLPLAAINLVVSDGILSIVATVAVVLRFVSVYRLGRKTRLHDWLTVVALTTMYGQVVCAMIGAGTAGYGLHVLEIFFKDPRQLVLGGKLVFTASLFWLVSTLAFRSAILLLYLEIFGSSAIFKYCCIVVQAMVILFFIGAMTTTLDLCHPIAREWDRSVAGKCGDGDTALIASAIVGTILDVVTVILPLPIVWRLQMALQKKVAITATFALGLGVCGINVARLVYTEVCDSDDFTYCTPISLIFVLCEMAGGILVACIPTLGPVFFPQRYQSRKLGNSSWQHHDSGKVDTKTRMVRLATRVGDITDDDSELVDLDYNLASSKVDVSRDSLESDDRRHHNSISR